MSDKLLLLSLFSARMASLFFLSPLLAGRGFFPRLILTLTTLLLIFPLFSSFASLEINRNSISLLIIKELFIGYLLGTLFAFMLEAAAFAGSWFANMAGFSATELLHLDKSKNPLFATLFMLITIAIILSLDLHHMFAYFLYDSFTFIPFTDSIPSSSFLTLSNSANYIFTQGLSIVFLPLFFLSIVILLMALLSKFNPEIPIFWLGFPIQIVTGFFSLSLLLLFLAPLIQKSFMQIIQMIHLIFNTLSKNEISLF